MKGGESVGVNRLESRDVIRVDPGCISSRAGEDSGNREPPPAYFT